MRERKQGQFPNPSWLKALCPILSRGDAYYPILSERVSTHSYQSQHNIHSMVNAIHLRHCGGSSAGYPIRG